MQLEEAVRSFMEGYFSTRRRSAKTRAAYKTDLSQLQNDIGSDKALTVVDANSLESWARVMRSRGYAPASVRRKFATVRTFFAYWTRKNLIERSPLCNIRLDLGRQRLLPRNLAASDAKRLIEQMWQDVKMLPLTPASPRDGRFLALRNATLLEVLFATGIRVGELVNLAVRDWHEDESAFVVMGKGQRQRLAIVPDERSQMAIKIYICQRIKMHLEHDFLFVNASGNRLSSQGVAQALAIAAKKAGLETRVTPHMIRHTFATLLLQCGADIRVVQEALGHASIMTTQRYTHVSKEHLLLTLKAHHPNNRLKIEVPAWTGQNQLVLPMY